MGHSGYGHHSGEASRSRSRWNTFPLVLFMVLQRFPGAKVEAPLFAEGFIVGSQLAIDETAMMELGDLDKISNNVRIL